MKTRRNASLRNPGLQGFLLRPNTFPATCEPLTRSAGVGRLPLAVAHPAAAPAMSNEGDGTEHTKMAVEGSGTDATAAIVVGEASAMYNGY